MVSSIPSQRERPTPAPTAIVHNGQTANALLLKRNPATKKEKRKISVFFIFIAPQPFFVQKI